MLPLEQTNDQKHTLDPFTLQSPITKAELEHKSERGWLHSKILDKSTFCKCIKSLSNSKSPGPDGVVDKGLRMLPHEFQDTIHILFVIMWATCLKPTSWKISDTVLIDKNKGAETNLSSYRPVKLANTP